MGDPAGTTVEIRWRPVLIVAGAIGAVVCAALIAAAPSDVRPQRRVNDAFDDYVAALRTRGEPITLPDLLGPDPPEAENAAGTIEAAFADIHATLDDDRAWRGTWPWDEKGVRSIGELPPDRLDELKSWVAGLEPRIDRIEVALDRPRFRFPLTADADGSPDAKHHRMLAKLELCLIVAAAAETTPERFVERARTCLRLARRYEPRAMGEWTTAVAISRGIAKPLRTRLESPSFGAMTARERLDPWLDSWLPAMRRAFHAEAMHVIAFHNAVMKSAPLAERTRTAPEEIEECRTALAIANAPTLSECRCRAAAATPASSDPDDLVLLFRQTIDAAYSYETVTRLARVALAISEFHARRGDFPATLDDLKPSFGGEVPVDPFTDAPFEYQTSISGAVVWSLGRRPEEPPIGDDALRDRCYLWELKR